jgi:hypothetical protein
MADEKTELFRKNAPQEKVLAEQSVPTTRQAVTAGDQETRQLHDSIAFGTAGQQALGEIGSGNEADTDAEALAAKAAAEAPATLVMPEIKKEEEAVPWAISIDLEQRIQRLSSATAAVNRELDALEASSKKLAKRMTS